MTVTIGFRRSTISGRTRFFLSQNLPIRHSSVTIGFRRSTISGRTRFFVTKPPPFGIARWLSVSGDLQFQDVLVFLSQNLPNWHMSGIRSSNFLAVSHSLICTQIYFFAGNLPISVVSTMRRNSDLFYIRTFNVHPTGSSSSWFFQ